MMIMNQRLDYMIRKMTESLNRSKKNNLMDEHRLYIYETSYLFETREAVDEALATRPTQIEFELSEFVNALIDLENYEK